ncbi:putative metallo-hydrolase [Pseudovibrio sp. Ad37]|nr:putative metallo-hydrolase [Pseudovibrio sp. Ad37]
MSSYPVQMDQKVEIKDFFDPVSNTITYVVTDPETKACAVIDSVMDIDYPAGRISFEHADEIIAYIRENDLKLEWLLETHVHADHLSAAPYIQQKLGGKIGIGEQVTVVQGVFGKVFNAGTEFARDGSQFDKLFQDGDTYQIGNLKCFAMHTPGHTPACMVHGACDW